MNNYSFREFISEKLKEVAKSATLNLSPDEKQAGTLAYQQAQQPVRPVKRSATLNLSPEEKKAGTLAYQQAQQPEKAK